MPQAAPPERVATYFRRDDSAHEHVAEQLPHLLGLIVLELLDPRERGALDPLRHNQFVRLFGISRFNGNRVRGMP